MIPTSAPVNAKRRFYGTHRTNLAGIPRQKTVPYRKALTKGETQPMNRDHKEAVCEGRADGRGTPQPAPEPEQEPGRSTGRHLLAVGYGAVADAFAGTASGTVAQINKDLARYVFWAVAALAAAVFALNLGAEAAFAQAQDTGDAIGQTLANVRNYLAGLAFGVGGIGFVASLLVKGYASINENAHAYAAMGMKGSLWCIVAGVIVTPILSIAAGLAGGGGGGGGN